MRRLLILGTAAAALIAAEDGKSAAELKGDKARGQALFEEVCADCHDGYSRNNVVGPGLQGLKDGKLPDGTAATRTRLLDIVNRGPAEMPSFKDRFTEQQKADVVEFALTL